jgi:hypothetical protein
MNSSAALRSFAAVVTGAWVCAAAGLATGGTSSGPDTGHRAANYPLMAPLDQYLMRDALEEIALARSAAPQAVSASATVLVLGPQGYETAVKGTNGFTCIVERGWAAPFESAEFWNPKVRAPICYNPAASRSNLLYTLRRTKLALAGRSREEMLAEVRGALARGELAPPEPGAMSFMMSKDGYLGDTEGHWHSHLMFHVPKAEAATWGANLPGSPVLFDERKFPEPQSIFLVPVGHWSDGTEAPAS